jgi:cytoskeleton protein RodZ
VLQQRKWTLAELPAPQLSGSGAAGSLVGTELRQARLRLGWTIEQISAALRIRAPYLQALEDGRLADIPGNAYAVAFTRSYATCLGLDANETVRRLRTEIQELNRKTPLKFPMPVPDRGVPAGAMVLLGVVLAILAYGGWYYVSGHALRVAQPVSAVPDRLEAMDNSTPHDMPSPQVASIRPETPVPPQAAAEPQSVSPSQAAAMSVPSAPPPAVASAASPSPVSANAAPVPTAAPAAEDGIVLSAHADTWLQVRARGGAILLNRVLRDGDNWTVPADRSDLLLTTGNAGGLDVVVDGTPLPALGGNGQVRRDLVLTPDALKALGPGKATPAAATGSPVSTPPVSTPRTVVQ